MTPLLLGGVAAAALLAATSIGRDASNPGPTPTPTPPFDYVGAIDPEVQIEAFLAVIRDGESSDNYFSIVGGGSFIGYTKHPGLNSDDTINKAFMPGAVSHACGAYQFQPGTWLECKRALKLSDFGPEAQDAAAVFLLKRRGAYNAITSGNIGAAVDLVKNEWQMFVTPQWNIARVIGAFQDYGGIVS